MSFRYQRDKLLPKGLVHGITSIMFESALTPAEPPEPSKSSSQAHQPTSKHQKGKNERQID